MQNDPDWVKRFPGAVTVSDRDHAIRYLNDKSAATFASDGGQSLVGKDLMACHKERSKEIIRGILESGKPNVYTIEKKGVRKLIFQSPWYEEGSDVPAGLVELSLELPTNMPHFIRD
ncbi:MAG: hypothetical protein NT080_09985 [Spirochaetes bacterium]|nr:hypothetical protein [Spirochaetota bacterium]